MRRLASIVNWAQNVRINSCGYSLAKRVIGRFYKLPWSHGKQSVELASLELPDHSPEFGQRMSWLRAARRAVETMDISHRFRRALVACVRASADIQGIVNGELVYVWRKVKKKQNRRADGTCFVTHRWHGPAIVSGKRRTTCLCLFAVDVTKVAPECLRKASVALQMSWDITTKEKACFENARNEEKLSWEEPLLNESCEFPEMPDTAVEPPNLEEEVNSPVNDDDDPPVSEPPVAENEDHDEGETVVEELDLVTEESPEVKHDQLRRRLTSKQPWRIVRLPEPSPEKEEVMESRLKKARVNVSELLHDAFFAEAARSKEKQ